MKKQNLKSKTNQVPPRVSKYVYSYLYDDAPFRALKKTTMLKELAKTGKVIDYDVLIAKLEKAFNNIAQDCIVNTNGRYEFVKDEFYRKALEAFNKAMKSSKIVSDFLNPNDISKIITDFKLTTQIKISKNKLKSIFK